MLVNRESTSKDDIINCLFCVLISSANLNESLTVNWLHVTGGSMGTRNFAIL